MARFCDGCILAGDCKGDFTNDDVEEFRHSPALVPKEHEDTYMPHFALVAKNPPDNYSEPMVGIALEGLVDAIDACNDPVETEKRHRILRFRKPEIIKACGVTGLRAANPVITAEVKRVLAVPEVYATVKDLTPKPVIPEEAKDDVEN